MSGGGNLKFHFVRSLTWAERIILTAGLSLTAVGYATYFGGWEYCGDGGRFDCPVTDQTRRRTRALPVCPKQGAPSPLIWRAGGRPPAG